jgi:hypothetical protein
MMVLIAALCCLPMVVWNLNHDWVSWRHVSGQAGVRDSAGWRWHGPFAYLGVQCALLLGVWFIVWAAAMIAHRPWQESDPGLRYLWCLSAPMFGIFLLFSLKTPEQPNWPVTAYLSGLVLAAGWFLARLRSPVRRVRWLARGCLILGSGLGVTVTVFMHYSEWLQPLLVRLAGPPTAERPLPLRRLDPTCRLRGWRFLAAEVDRIRAELRAEGIDPVLAGSAWTLPGELAFYCQGHPPVYSLGLALGDRHSQYDCWRPNPVWDPAAFAGRTVLFVGEVGPALREAFEQLDEGRVVVYRERGQPIAAWRITVCRGFRGFRNLPAIREGMAKW